MGAHRYELVLHEDAGRRLTLDGLSSCTGVHPSLVERFVEFGLIEPVAWMGSRPLFDVAVVSRLRVVERLRCDLGMNLPGIAVVLDIVERLRALQAENELLRSRL